jgi:trigger factor
MKARLLEREGIRARIEVELSESEVARAYGEVYRSLAKQLKVPGFRPGKAPRKVLEARVGPEAIHQEVRDVLVERFYPKAIQELKLLPVKTSVEVGRPIEGEAFSFQAELELYPEVELADPKDIVIDSEIPRLGDEQLKRSLELIRRDHATLLPVDRAVEPGDYLVVASLPVHLRRPSEVSLRDSSQSPQGHSLWSPARVSEGSEETGNVMPLDLETMEEDLAQAFYGKTVGDVVDLKLPVDEPAEEGTLEATTLTLRIEDVRAKEKPELDDDFAKTLGFESWAEAEASIRRSLQANLEQEGFAEQREEFIDKLVEGSDVDIPESLLGRQKDALKDRFEESLKRRGLNLEGYLSHLDTDRRQGFEAELEEAAAKQVKRDLVLEKLLVARGTTLSERDFERALELMARERGINPLQLRRELGETGLHNYRYLLVRNKAVQEAVLELTAVSREPASAPEIQEASTQSAQEVKETEEE